jgi:hypothetical protein
MVLLVPVLQSCWVEAALQPALAPGWSQLSHPARPTESLGCSLSVGAFAAEILSAALTLLQHMTEAARDHKMFADKNP